MILFVLYCFCCKALSIERGWYHAGRYFSRLIGIYFVFSCVFTDCFYSCFVFKKAEPKGKLQRYILDILFRIL